MSPPTERSGPRQRAAARITIHSVNPGIASRREGARQQADVYAAGFAAGWADRAEYERRTRFSGEDYLLGFRDGLVAAGGGAA